LSWSGASREQGLEKETHRIGRVLGVALGGAALWIFAQPGPAPSTASAPASNLADFSHWAVVLVAGDYRAIPAPRPRCSTMPAMDLAAAFAKIGFSKANMVQFSVDYDEGTQHTSVSDIAAGLQGVTARARAGCLIYFTSHGTPDGIIHRGRGVRSERDARHGEQRLRQPP